MKFNFDKVSKFIVNIKVSYFKWLKPSHVRSDKPARYFISKND